MSTISGYLTLQEAADKIGVSHSQVSRYVRDGKLPSILLGNMKLIPEKDVKKFTRPRVGNPNFQKKD